MLALEAVADEDVDVPEREVPHEKAGLREQPLFRREEVPGGHAGGPRH